MPAHSSFPHPLGSLKDREKSRASGISMGLDRRLGLSCPELSVRLSMSHWALK